jgi:hypothetical protein
MKILLVSLTILCAVAVIRLIFLESDILHYKQTITRLRKGDNTFVVIKYVVDKDSDGNVKFKNKEEKFELLPESTTEINNKPGCKWLGVYIRRGAD